MFFLSCRCEVVGEQVSTPVCVTVTDQQVDEFCEEQVRTNTLLTNRVEIKTYFSPQPLDVDGCFERSCRRATRTVFDRVCNPEVEQVTKERLYHIKTNCSSP